MLVINGCKRKRKGFYLAYRIPLVFMEISLFLFIRVAVYLSWGSYSMDQNDFIIASRYQIRPALNAISDILLQIEVRVEPRLMKVLCILSSHPRQLVTREQLVKEIWADYGGGEEGLNHAISSLRKLLNDASKELIQTIPKKGYILHGEIASFSKENKAVVSKEKRYRRKPALYASAILLMAIVLYGIKYFQLRGKRDATLTSTAKEISVPFSEVNKKTKETRLNTIITVGADSIQYKLKVVGDSRPQFYINGRLLSPDEMENHLDLINNLKGQLIKRRNINSYN